MFSRKNIPVRKHPLEDTLQKKYNFFLSVCLSVYVYLLMHYISFAPELFTDSSSAKVFSEIINPTTQRISSQQIANIFCSLYVFVC